jgi:catechol 2,3-dioxygenase-like lactoylglutathione lyase family enzyme
LRCLDREGISLDVSSCRDVGRGGIFGGRTGIRDPAVVRPSSEREAAEMIGIEDLVEIGIYAQDLDRAERFYADVLGLEIHSREDGRHVFFRVGDRTMLLVFRPDATLMGGILPSHGAKGPGHFAMGIATADLDAWRRRLGDHGVSIEHEETCRAAAIPSTPATRRVTPSN